MPLNETQYLLDVLSEECNEIAVRASKAIRFGLDEIQPGQSLTNAQRLALELDDLYEWKGLPLILSLIHI
ncbi:hypothetical protein, partial [Escherichia coli]|uniref:hypothetical protein n=1 Tax=Escherichia coli TaxID=562 RepID=UPI000E2A7B2C